MPTHTPTLPEVLATWRDSTMRDLRVCLPGRVTAYDAGTQLADIKPEIQDFFFDEDDSTTSISIPVITNVPVIWMGGGGGYVTCPLTVGDKVLIVFADRSIDAWLAQGGEQAPVDQRRHNLSDAIALAGLHDNQHAIPNVPTDGVAMGMANGQRIKVTASAVQLGTSATQAAVNGTTFLSGLDTILRALQVYVTAAAVPSGGAAAALTTFNTALSAFQALARASTTVTLQP